ncbi:MAG: TetR/AcrR family transcriptional regulator [Treponema sp.]|nr:TetR/AcrR family transcriptional regulator [Spirochaetia bacterium]MDD6968839.1 TetR/AcrR family transcriptional regulator [Spirochaetales bacterium]MDY4526053.1 TetR/AcrR family transcriptional regulator [Treponema sp.]MDD7611161.1 TetR/AcrR family transcriptional regulator [Spirochaetales bacterium]MDY4832939.1 TetR/AcrR family transcriptional regulator [Treponema sp.]
MAIVVEHDKRKHEILQKSLDVFVEQGYEDATFQKIADHCGITRTTLYIYFKNKHEIFLGSIKELLSELETNLRDIIKKDMDSIESLKQILFTIVDACENNKKLFSVLLNYLLQLKKAGVDTNERVRRRVIKMRHLLSTVLIKGIQKGEIKSVNVKDINELLYGMIEASIFRIAVLNQESVMEVKLALGNAIDLLK